MSSEVTVSDALKDCLAQLCSTIYESIRIIDALIGVAVEHDSVGDLRQETMPIPDKVAPVLSLMLQALGSSSYTLLKLSNAPGLQTRDCYSITRSIVEMAVNICYVVGEGTSAAERAQKHAQQKSFRDLERASKIGNTMIQLVYSGRPDSSSIEGLDEQIKEFTSRAGREKGWIDLSIDDRIEVVGRHLGESILHFLHSARFMIYRHSSEILHGTFFSALYFFGLTEPSGKTRTLEEIVEFVGQQHMMVLLATVFSLSAVIESFDQTYGFKKLSGNYISRKRRLSKISIDAR